MVRLRVALLTVVAVACGSSTEDPRPYPVAWSWSTATSRSAELRFLLPTSSPNCPADSVSVTGPGIGAPLQLDCSAGTGAVFGGTVDLGAPGPAPPLAYTFTATLGGVTRTYLATVNCYLDPAAGVAPLPGATVTSPVALSWSRPAATGVPAPTGIQYAVSASGSVTRTVSLVDQWSATVDLAPGVYGWAVAAVPVGLYDGTSALTCGSQWLGGAFTVE